MKKVDTSNVRPMMLESVDLEKYFDPFPTGETGDNSLTFIPLQEENCIKRFWRRDKLEKIEGVTKGAAKEATKGAARS
ncbi:hypothetical protein P3L10_027966 [Capsicum annuum]